jgi:hypothetical protein
VLWNSKKCRSFNYGEVGLRWYVEFKRKKKMFTGGDTTKQLWQLPQNVFFVILPIFFVIKNFKK